MEYNSNTNLINAAQDMLAALEAADRLLTFLGPSPEDLDDDDEVEVVEKAVWLQVQEAIKRGRESLGGSTPKQRHKAEYYLGVAQDILNTTPTKLGGNQNNTF